MIRNDRPFGDIVAVADRDGAPTRIRSGDVLRVDVLDASRPDRVRIRLAGAIIFASGVHRVSAGESFRARVTLSGGALLLTPLPGLPSGIPAEGGTLARIGLPETPVTVLLAAFFRSINARLDPALLRSITALASRFPGKEKRAAEAAAILAERGIEPDEATVARLLACIEGEGAEGTDGAASNLAGSGASGETSAADGGENREDGAAASSSARSRRFLSFVNAKRGSEFHWVIVPFALALANRPCRGSVRFLLDLTSGAVLQTRIACLDGIRDWDFLLSGTECSFNADPGFTAATVESLARRLARSLESAGIASAVWRPDLARGEDLPRVDVRA